MPISGRFATIGRFVSDSTAVYVDANILIYAVEGVSGDISVTERCRRLLDAFRRRMIVGVTSELTLAEVLVEPTRRKMVDAKRGYMALLNARRPVLDLRPVTRGILLESVSYRAAIYPARVGPTEDKRNFLPDAIHVATAIAAGASHYAGSDKRLRLPAGLSRLDPREPAFDPMLFKLLA